MQITISIVFFDSLWIKTNKGMTRALVSEIAAFIDAYENENSDKEKIINLLVKVPRKHPTSKTIRHLLSKYFTISFSIGFMKNLFSR